MPRIFIAGHNSCDIYSQVQELKGIFQSESDAGREMTGTFNTLPRAGIHLVLEFVKMQK